VKQEKINNTGNEDLDKQEFLTAMGYLEEKSIF